MKDFNYYLEIASKTSEFSKEYIEKIRKFIINKVISREVDSGEKSAKAVGSAIVGYDNFRDFLVLLGNELDFNNEKLIEKIIEYLDDYVEKASDKEIVKMYKRLKLESSMALSKQTEIEESKKNRSNLKKLTDYIKIAPIDVLVTLVPFYLFKFKKENPDYKLINKKSPADKIKKLREAYLNEVNERNVNFFLDKFNSYMNRGF